MVTFHRIKSEVGTAVLERDAYMCFHCGSRGNLCVHHREIVPEDSGSFNDLGNLVVVCRSCHMSLHRVAGDIIPSGNISYWGRRGKDNPEVNCQIEGCGRKQHARALCNKHYESYRRHTA